MPRAKAAKQVPAALLSAKSFKDLEDDAYPCQLRGMLL